MKFKTGDLVRNINSDMSGVVLKVTPKSFLGSIMEVKYSADLNNSTSIDYTDVFQLDYQKIREIKINEILNGIS